MTSKHIERRLNLFKFLQARQISPDPYGKVVRVKVMTEGEPVVVDAVRGFTTPV